MREIKKRERAWSRAQMGRERESNGWGRGRGEKEMRNALKI